MVWKFLYKTTENSLQCSKEANNDSVVKPTKYKFIKTQYRYKKRAAKYFLYTKCHHNKLFYVVGIKKEYPCVTDRRTIFPRDKDRNWVSFKYFPSVIYVVCMYFSIRIKMSNCFKMSWNLFSKYPFGLTHNGLQD